MANPKNQKSAALQLIIIFGLVSLFGDIVYEGARSVNGPYLKTLGVSAAIVGLIAGLGEFLGYFLRLASGYFADKTKAYWLFTFFGYLLLISVPLLSLTGVWQMAAVFIIMERIGKAIRNPARDTILSQATKQVGTGFGFGLHEAMDQIGAIVGPLIFAVLFTFLGRSGQNISEYQLGYSVLWIPFLLVMLCIAIAYVRIPHPEHLEISATGERGDGKLSKVFWLYVIFTFITAAGFVNFVLIGYHFKAKNVLTDAQIPFFYALAMAIDGITALAVGKYYDRLKNKNKNDKAGLLTLIIIPVFSILIPIFAFRQNMMLAIIGVLIWGVVMGTHETIMRSAIADLTPLRKRGTGYGIFNTSYGLAVFVGSFLMGLLYDHSISALIALAVVIELGAIFMFFLIKKEILVSKI